MFLASRSVAMMGALIYDDDPRTASSYGYTVPIAKAGLTYLPAHLSLSETLCQSVCCRRREN
jgi:hypothetical protein